MKAILDFGYGFKSQPQQLPEQLHGELRFSYYLFGHITAVVGDKFEEPDKPKELTFEWRGQVEDGARVYKLSDVKIN